MYTFAIAYKNYCYCLCQKVSKSDKVNACNKERKQKKNRMQGIVLRKTFTNDRVTKNT